MQSCRFSNLNEVIIALISNVEKTDQRALSIKHGEQRIREM